MDKYKLYGITLIKDDSSLKAFADSVVEIIGNADIVEGITSFLEQNEAVLENVDLFLKADVSRTEINYVELLERYAPDIGPVLYCMDNWGLEMPTIDFFNENARAFFEFIVKGYIYQHLDEYRRRYLGDEGDTEDMQEETAAPESGWVRGDSVLKPKDKQLCLAIPKNSDYVGIFLYLTPEKQWPRFVDISEIYADEGYVETTNPAFIEQWKPLDLPDDMHGRILAALDQLYPL